MPKPPARINDDIKCDKHGGGHITTGQATVTFEDQEVACEGDEVKHKDGTKTTIKPGKACVVVNGKRVALVGDATKADGTVNSGAGTIQVDEGIPFVFIGANVQIGRNVSFNTKKPAAAESDRSAVLEAALGVLEIVGGIPEDEVGVGEALQIAGYKVTKHALERMTERKITRKAIEDTLKNPIKVNPVKIGEEGLPSQRYIGQKAEVVVNPEEGNIVSVNPTSKSKLARLMRSAK